MSEFARDATLTEITAHRAAILSLVVQRATADQIGSRLSISANTVRTHIRILRELTGCHSIHELRDFWLQRRFAWVMFMAGQAGLETTNRYEEMQEITLRSVRN